MASPLSSPISLVRSTGKPYVSYSRHATSPERDGGGCECNNCGNKFGQKRLTIVHGFWPETEKFDFGKKRIPPERAPQEEQNGTNFSFIAFSSEEL